MQTAFRYILDFVITAVDTQGGKQAALVVDNMSTIPLGAMGEGVTHILGFIATLAVAEEKVFLIEELENDLHPQALKGLLNLIAEKSLTNQFIITTHSNIVLKQLGAVDNSKVFHVDSGLVDNLPTSSVMEVLPASEARREILQELGYELYDIDLWEAWLFLEESSAERIIRDYLIPWFASNLMAKLRTFSADGLSKVEPKFTDFNNLFVFLHLEPTYKNKVWVVVDEGEEEKKVIDDFKEKYSSWESDRFRQFTEHDFESYYPTRFVVAVAEALSQTGKKAKRKKKKELLDDVLDWIEANKEEARAEFESSAAEVIVILKEIETSLAG